MGGGAASAGVVLSSHASDNAAAAARYAAGVVAEYLPAAVAAGLAAALGIDLADPVAVAHVGPSAQVWLSWAVSGHALIFNRPWWLALLLVDAPGGGPGIEGQANGRGGTGPRGRLLDWPQEGGGGTAANNGMARKSRPGRLFWLTKHDFPTCCRQKKTAAQRSLEKVDTSKMKSISSFFGGATKGKQ